MEMKVKRVIDNHIPNTRAMCIPTFLDVLDHLGGTWWM